MFVYRRVEPGLSNLARSQPLLNKVQQALLPLCFRRTRSTSRAKEMASTGSASDLAGDRGTHCAEKLANAAASVSTASRADAAPQPAVGLPPPLQEQLQNPGRRFLDVDLQGKTQLEWSGAGDTDT